MRHLCTLPSVHRISRSPSCTPPPAPSEVPCHYRHNPYSWDGPQPVSFAGCHHDGPSRTSPAPEGDTPAPAGTCHPALWGRVSFVPYPTEEFHAPPPPTEADGELVRVFVGQLPYFVTDMQLDWLCFTFGGGVVAYPERIMKKQPSGERLPTGCIHAYTTFAGVDDMLHGMHKRMLVDDTGVWYAQTSEEFEVLSHYVEVMKGNKSLRVHGRPYDTVVVQIAVSNFYSAAHKPVQARLAHTPPPQAWNPPPTYHSARQTLPPSYADTVPPPPPYAAAHAEG